MHSTSKEAKLDIAMNALGATPPVVDTVHVYFGPNYKI